jgi:hypothetical protein
MKRKIIQIAYSEIPTESDGTGTVLALCNDGSLWFRIDPWKDGHNWHRINVSDIEDGNETVRG